jgi:restriction system protein
MAIPDYEELMLPVLSVAGDGQEHRIGDVIEGLAKNFRLTDEERNQLLPSGKQTTFANRVHWARGYLVQAGLLEATKRAHFRITNRGRKALSEGLSRIDNDYLRIPTQSGQGFRFDVGHRSDLIPATIPK